MTKIKEKRLLTEYGKKVGIAIYPKDNPEHEKISLFDYNELYNCRENNHLKRAVA